MGVNDISFWFNLHFLNDWLCWTSLHVLVGRFIYRLWRNVYSSLPVLIGLFFFLLLSCNSSLYILDTRHLSDTWFAIIFSHSIGYHFHFINSVLSYTKYFNFDEVHLSHFSFVSCAFMVLSKKTCLTQLCRFTLIFFWKILHFTFYILGIWSILN